MKEETLYDKRLPAVLNDSFEAKYKEMDIKAFIENLKEDIAEELCRTSFVDNREQNKAIRDIVFGIFVEHINKLAGSKLT